MSTQTLRVSLPSEIIYVSGTVNDVAYTWTLEDGAWVAVVDRAEDDRYVVVLTAVNSLGTSATYQLTLFYGLLNLITDRTKADVDRVVYLAKKGLSGMTAEEKAEFNNSPKGEYTAVDLNRVGAAVDYVAGRFRANGYKVDVSPRQDWKRSDSPTWADAEAYLKDIRTLRGLVAVMSTTPEVPADARGLTWAEANHIEQILLDLDALVTDLMQAWYYSGDLYAGEI